MKMLGIILIVLGLAGLIVQGVTYTTHEKVLDVGSLHVTAEKEKTMPIPAIAGGLALAAGVALVVADGRKKG
jgi:hypothetical protein